MIWLSSSTIARPRDQLRARGRRPSIALADSAAEVAFVLAAAVAFADNAIADEENETLSALAEGLGIDESRANELLDSVEADLADRPA
jgi:hypothetical protein